jgi:MFS family permease
MGLFFITVVAFIRAPLLPEIGRDLDMSPTALGALIAAFALGRIITDVPAGRLTDHRAARPMLAIGAIIVALGSLTGGLAPSSAVAFLASFILGVGSAWTNTTGIAAFAEAPRERRGVAMSGFAAALMVGQAIGPTLGGAVASVWDWRAAFLVGATIGLAMAAILALSARGPAVEHGVVAGSPSEVAATTLLALYLLPAVQFGIGAALIQTLVPIVGDAELALSVGTIGLAIGLGGLLRLIGALASGQVSDRYSRRWALLPGLALQFLGLIVFAVGGAVANWWAAIILYSLGSSSVNVGATVLADLSEGGGLGRRLGVFRLTGDAALLLAPLAGGALYEAFGRGWASMPLIGFVACVIALAFVAIPETVRVHD